jgi:spore coat polysaccharide biosynthesis predicted glycosyltransferase SpsG
MVRYVDRMVESRSIGADEIEKEYEDKMNVLVYSLYDLTEDDIKLIKSMTV